MGALEQVLVQDLKLPGFEFGTALIAAQKVYAERSATAAEERSCFCGRSEGCCSLMHPEYGVTDVKPVM